jgi:hypothetical protein
MQRLAIAGLGLALVSTRVFAATPPSLEGV